MSHAPASEDQEIGFQIAPMVDVVFVLLLFFMATAGSQVVTRELSTNLPGSQPSRLAVVPIEVAIDAQGLVRLNGQVIDKVGGHDLPELQAWFEKTLARFGDRDPVIIRPDPSTPHARVIDVLNTASRAGVKKITFG